MLASQMTTTAAVLISLLGGSDTADALIGLGEASRSLGQTGRERKPIHPATLTRWILVGVRQPDGSRLKLHALRIGSKWSVRPSWLAEFLDALTAARTAPEVGTQTRSPSERNRAAEAANAELIRMGA